MGKAEYSSNQVKSLNNYVYLHASDTVLEVAGDMKMGQKNVSVLLPTRECRTDCVQGHRRERYQIRYRDQQREGIHPSKVSKDSTKKKVYLGRALKNRGWNTKTHKWKSLVCV